MKSLSGRLGVILIAGLAIFGCAGTQGTHWRVFNSTDFYEGSYYVEGMTRSTNKVSRKPKDRVRVSIKLQYTEKGIAEYVKKFGKGYGNLSYSLQFWEIDCVMQKHRILSFHQYSTKGDILNTDKAKDLYSDSVDNSLSKAVCK